MRSIRGGMGLGDALYVQAVARHLAAKGERLKVATAWPDVFRPLNGSVECMPFTRAGISIVAHYTTQKGRRGTTQFEDVCATAGLSEPVPLSLDWRAPTSSPLLDRVREVAAGRPIVLVQLMRPPMNRKDRFGASLLPSGAVMQLMVDRVRDRACLVQVGSGKRLHELTGVDLDLADRTTVSELLDVATIAAGLVGYVSFFVPLAESLGKPAVFLWSSRGLRDPVAYVRQITPEKVLHRKDLAGFAVDDWPRDKIEGVVDAFLQKI